MTKQRISFEWEGFLVWTEEEPLEPGSTYLGGPDVHVQNKFDLNERGITITSPMLSELAVKLEYFQKLLSMFPRIQATVIDDDR